MSRIALVTGASSGIGEATALELQRRGFAVYAAARRVERMAALAEQGMRTLALDVTDEASLTAGVGRILEASGRVDLLVNNAGYGAYGALEDVPLDEARRQFEVNLFGLARLTQLLLPAMRERRRGRIVNISSMGGIIYEPLGAWYHATKFAVEGLSDSLRLELAPFGIDVVVIQPGVTRSEWGPIAADGLLATSGATAYADQARRVAAVLRETAADESRSSPPQAVATVIGQAATARQPKTRYIVGYGAGRLIAARRLLPDRAFDRVMGLIYREAGG